MRLLTVRERSAAELRSRLRQKGFDPTTVEATLERLRRSGLQDDVRFAEGFASAAVRNKGSASRLVQSELRRRGVDKETAARAAVRAPEEEMENALELARRKAERLRGQPREVVARRIAGLLARRGYSGDVVETVLAATLSDAGVSLDDG